MGGSVGAEGEGGGGAEEGVEVLDYRFEVFVALLEVLV